MMGVGVAVASTSPLLLLVSQSFTFVTAAMQ